MLEHYLVAQIYAFFLIFCRVGSGVMILPGFGETYVSQRLRLSFALMVCLMLTPLLGALMPPFPDSPLTLAIIVICEIVTGLFIGGICTIIISATHTAGMIFSFQSGLSSAVIYDVTESSQGSVVGNFLGILIIVMVFDLNLHHLMLRGLTESYSIFLPGHFPPLADFVNLSAHLVSSTFSVALQICAPIIVATTLLFLGGGILSRLMPTIQIFFLITGPQILISFFILIGAFSAMFLWYLDFFRETLVSFLSYVK